MNKPMIEEDFEMKDSNPKAKDFGALKIAKLMLTGQYTYLTYMMLSASCFFFWITPNHHKIKAMLRPFT
jgi:hypothetical protein